jgi:hypothetical protein
MMVTYSLKSLILAFQYILYFRMRVMVDVRNVLNIAAEIFRSYKKNKAIR